MNESLRSLPVYSATIGRQEKNKGSIAGNLHGSWDKLAGKERKLLRFRELET